MKISLDWISQYVDVSGIAPATLAERLTMATAEVEEVETLTRSLDGVRIGRVVSVETLAEHTSFVRVECDTDEFTTVCGAPNVRVGMTSAFAPAGVTLANGLRLEERQIAGRASQGVLCSSEELGMGGGHMGIIDLPDSVESGRLLSELIPRTDTIIEIDNKSLTHRPDLWGHYGIAREVAAILGRPLQRLGRADLSVYDGLPAYPLTLEDLENCPCYCCIEMANVAAVPTPLSIQYRLQALGQRTFNILVDLTNYIMLELAQPMHAFDGAHLQAVRIAPFGTDGNFMTLDGQARLMQPDDLMIWNEKEPVALAGIMGGLNSEVGPDTTTLLLESANFKGARIRRTATRLGLQTDASQRFEKQQPPATTKIGIERFVSLLQEAGVSPEVQSRFTYGGDLKEEVRRLSIAKDFFDRRIGNPIASDKIVSILTSIGFEAKMDIDNTGNAKLQVGIPPFRSEKDIALPVDILEEVTRINGYDNLTPQLPGFSADTVAFADSLRAEHKARRLLAQAYDFSEVHNYSWFDETWLQTLGYDPEAALRVANPSAEQNVRLCTSLIPNLLAVVKRNALHSDRFRIFELGPGYLSVGEKDRRETLFLSGASFQQDKIAPLEEHFRTVKGAIEALAGQLNVGELSFTPGAENVTPWQTAGSYVHISQATKPVGSLGFLNGSLLNEMAAKSQVVWFELDFNSLDGPLFPDLKYAAGSRYPGSWFDFSILAPLEASFAELVSTLDTFSHPFLKKREFVTLYTGKGLEPGMGSYTFRYWIESKDSTLTGEQIEAFQHEYITFLTSKGLKLR